MSNRTAAQKVFDEMSEPFLCENQIVSSEENDAHSLFNANEMIVSDSGILQQEEVVCVAQLVFDKLSEPILSSNIDQIAIIGDDHSLLNNIDEIRPEVPEPYIGEVPDYVRTAHTLFHTMPVPDFILEMAKVAKTIQEENEAMVGAHQLFATMPEPTEQANARQTRCQSEVINNETAPSKVFDELTLPTFIKEMAQAASFVEESTPVSEIKADAKGFKDNSYLANDPCVLVFDPGVLFLHINEIEIGPCAKFLGLISGWKAHVNYKKVHSWGKYRSYTQFALLEQLKKVSYFRGDVTKPPILKLCYVRTLHHGCATINFKKMSRFLPNHFFGHMKQPPALGHSLVNIHSHSSMDYTNMLLGYGYKDQNASIFIFDPSGFKCWLSWLKMMKILEAYQNNGRNSENYQIYVFDPGGPLIRLVMDDMVTNPKPGMCYATSSFKHCLSLILP